MDLLLTMELYTKIRILETLCHQELDCLPGHNDFSDKIGDDINKYDFLR